MQDIQKKVEAVLFITGKALTMEEIANFCNIGSLGSVKEAIESLIKDYQERCSSLEVVKEENRYRLNIRKEYNHLSTKLISNCELDAPTQATLALIAYKQPILQSDIIKMRGNTAYDHVHALKEMEFIISEKNGRTRSLRLAPKFFEYFDVVEENLKKKFGEIAEKQEKLVLDEQKKITEKVEELIPEVKEEKKTRTKKLEVKAIVEVSNKIIEVQRTSKEDLIKLNSDDFGST